MTAATRRLREPYNRVRGKRMTAGLKFLWTATRGHRLRPWKSEFLRWRLETFTGKHAEEVGPRDFWQFLISERRQLLRFLRWLAEMREYAGADGSE